MGLPPTVDYPILQSYVDEVTAACATSARPFLPCFALLLHAAQDKPTGTDTVPVVFLQTDSSCTISTLDPILSFFFFFLFFLVRAHV